MDSLDKFMKEFIAFGMGCGERIAAILKKRHPKATVFPLYRSAIAIEYDPQEKVLKIFAAGDPHVLGKELVDENLTEEEYVITGNRFSPLFYKILEGKAFPLKL
jgi:hypothetical protein